MEHLLIEIENLESAIETLSNQHTVSQDLHWAMLLSKSYLDERLQQCMKQIKEIK